MRRHAFKVAATAAVLCVLVVAMAAAAAIRTAGPQPEGTAITPQGWLVTPAGSQTDLGLWPMDVAMSPAGNLLLVANAGYAHHSLMAIDPASGVNENIPLIDRPGSIGCMRPARGGSNRSVSPSAVVESFGVKGMSDGIGPSPGRRRADWGVTIGSWW